MVQYTWKEFAEKPKYEQQSSKERKETTTPKKIITPDEIDCMNKQQLVKLMDKQHPVVSLEIGTIRANVKRAVDGNENVTKAVVDVLQNASQIAWTMKRRTELVLGAFIHNMEKKTEAPSKTELQILDLICPRIKDPTTICQETEYLSNLEDNQHQVQFLALLMRRVYSGECRHTGNGKLVDELVAKSGILITQSPKTFPGTSLLQSSARSLAGAIRVHYKKGCSDMTEKVRPSLHCRIQGFSCTVMCKGNLTITTVAFFIILVVQRSERGGITGTYDRPPTTGHHQFLSP
jgi:hypothetical protein